MDALSNDNYCRRHIHIEIEQTTPNKLKGLDGRKGTGSDGVHLLFRSNVAFFS